MSKVRREALKAFKAERGITSPGFTLTDDEATEFREHFRQLREDEARRRCEEAGLPFVPCARTSGACACYRCSRYVFKARMGYAEHEKVPAYDQEWFNRDYRSGDLWWFDPDREPTDPESTDDDPPEPVPVFTPAVMPSRRPSRPGADTPRWRLLEEFKADHGYGKDDRLPTGLMSEFMDAERSVLVTVPRPVTPGSPGKAGRTALRGQYDDPRPGSPRPVRAG